MYKITTICAIAIGVPHLLLAKEVPVHCVENAGQENEIVHGQLFDGKPISVDENNRPRIFSLAELNQRCKHEFISLVSEERRDEDDQIISAVLK